VTIAWRVLEEYPLVDRSSYGFEPREAPWITESRGELDSLSGAELERLLEALQARGFSQESRPILGLGVLSDAEQRGVFEGVRPASLAPERAAAWDAMLSGPSGPDVHAQARHRATLRAAGVSYPTYVAPGCTYLLRTGRVFTPESSSDRVVAFTILREDDYGYSIIWRPLGRH
jgi:hypothetical protein